MLALSEDNEANRRTGYPSNTKSMQDTYKIPENMGNILENSRHPPFMGTCHNHPFKGPFEKAPTAANLSYEKGVNL
jgi:hypothetical protein